MLMISQKPAGLYPAFPDIHLPCNASSPQGTGKQSLFPGFQPVGYWQTERVALGIYALVGACNAGRNRIADRYRIIF